MNTHSPAPAAHPRLNRREAMRWAVGAAAGCSGWQALAGAARAIDFDKPAPEAEHLTMFQPQGEAQVLFRWNNLPLTAYRAHASQKYPYFYPLNGLASGLSLTTESGLPYPHHRGLWLGCEPLNGGDYWGDSPLAKGQVRSLGLSTGVRSQTEGEFHDRCVWQQADQPSPLRDERTFVVRVLNDHAWCIDCDFRLTANETDAVITKAKHSFFAIRAAADISPTYGGTLANSEGGVGADGTYGKPARWCGYHGPRKQRPDVVEGIAVMDHPENFGGNCPWFTRDYGHLSPSPFNFQSQPWTLDQGQTLRLRYRIVMHTGTPQSAGLDNLFDQWLAG